MQKSIAKAVSCHGIGIHSGKKVEISLKPAPIGHGIEVVRTDLGQSVQLYPDVFDGANNQTCIKNNNKAFLKTVEHLMAAVFSKQIDNMIIEANSEEMPAVDGSAMSYLELLKKAGIVEQEGPDQPALRLNKMLLEKGKEDTFIAAVPADEFKISLAVEYRLPVGLQVWSVVINEENFHKEVAPARTFGWKEDLDKMHKNGLGLGVKVNENAIGIAENKGYSCPLRFADEIVRHKVLDLVGDLAGLRKNIKAHIIGYKTNHRLNIQFMKKLAKI
ncbi:UDP-3-O-acyl-N-acetylglucosamine deacetylase [Candidatus Margulisiibacteriota bacterium]